MSISFERLKFGSHAAFLLTVGIFILAMLKLGGGDLSFGAVLFAVMVPWVLKVAGDMLLAGIGVSMPNANMIVPLVVGYAVITILMVALAFVFKLSAFNAMLILTGIISATRWKLRTQGNEGGACWIQVAVVAALGIAIACLAWIPISSPLMVRSQGVLPIWNDYYIHGVTIASFGSPFSLGTDMEVAGMPRVFYHYAPFMIPAVFQAVSGLDGLAVSTAVLLPLGLMVGGLGIYVLAVVLGGKRNAVLTLTAIVCVPAYIGIVQPGWFDFYWLLLISPGAGYAIGVASVACAALLTYSASDDRHSLWLALLLLFSLIFIRVHMFVLLAPALVGTAILHRWYGCRYRMLGALLAILIAVGAVLGWSGSARALWEKACQPSVYLNTSVAWTHVLGITVHESGGAFSKMVVQLVIVLVSVLGYYTMLYPAAAYFKVRRSGWQAQDFLVPMLVLAFILLMLFAPTPGNGDFTEFKHRHFLLLYVIVVTFTVSLLFGQARRFGASVLLEGSSGLYIGCALLLVLTIALNWNSNPAAPNFETMPWSRSYHLQKITPGVVESAGYLKDHSERGDVFAMEVSSIGSNLNAPVIELIALSGLPSFVARPEVRTKLGSCMKAEIDRRVAVLHSLSMAEDRAVAEKLLSDNGIRWYLVLERSRPKWDPNLQWANFRGNGIAVYDNGKPFDTTRLGIEC